MALPTSLLAIQQSGSVRAADQLIPGATVTARQGDMKVVTYTDENGRYTLNLTPGEWNIQIQILGFTPVQEQVTVGTLPSFKDWTLEMPRPGGSTGPVLPASTATATGGRRRGPPGAGGQGQGGQGRGGFGRGGAGQVANGRGGAPAQASGTTPTTQAAAPGAQQRPGFQNAAPT